MADRVFEAMRTLLDDTNLVDVGSTSEAAAYDEYRVLSFRMKIQGLVLIDCSWQ